MDNKYANLHMWTDVLPFEITRVISDKTMEVRAMKYKLADNEKPEFIPGGFAGHCTNQRGLKYDFETNPDSMVIRIRLRKDGKWHSKFGRHIPTDHPIAFDDYNF